MDNRYIEKVLGEMAPFFEEQGFKAGKDGEYKKEDTKVKVEYSDERQMYLLKLSAGEGEYEEISAWLFDDSQNERDAASVGIDFTETLTEKLGVKKNSRVTRMVDMPQGSKDGADVAAFTKRILDVYPQFKDAYRDHVQKYGNFLYLNFFGETLVPQLKATFASGDRKAIKKIMPVFESTYITGNREAVNAMVACIAAAVADDEAALAALAEALKENTHMLRAVNELSVKIKSNKKLRAALLK